MSDDNELIRSMAGPIYLGTGVDQVKSREIAADVLRRVRLHEDRKATDETMTARYIRENTITARNGLIVTRVNGVPMIDSRLVEELIERQERAFKSLIRAIEGQGFSVLADVNGTFTVEPRLP